MIGCMPNDAHFIAPAISTPCVGICRLDGRGYCVGCLRTGDEIARWRSMDEVERQYVMREVLPRRKLP